MTAGQTAQCADRLVDDARMTVCEEPRAVAVQLVAAGPARRATAVPSGSVEEELDKACLLLAEFAVRLAGSTGCGCA